MRQHGARQLHQPPPIATCHLVETKKLQLMSYNMYKVYARCPWTNRGPHATRPTRPPSKGGAHRLTSHGEPTTPATPLRTMPHRSGARSSAISNTICQLPPGSFGRPAPGRPQFPIKNNRPLTTAPWPAAPEVAAPEVAPGARKDSAPAVPMSAPASAAPASAVPAAAPAGAPASAAAPASAEPAAAAKPASVFFFLPAFRR